jgi:hypothetical protein
MSYYQDRYASPVRKYLGELKKLQHLEMDHPKLCRTCLYNQEKRELLVDANWMVH